MTPEYQAWARMRKRCFNRKCPDFPNYGGRGITVCDRWCGWGVGFRNFLTDMGPRPSPQHSLDRCDNDGDYEPGNCRWATRQEQNENRRSVKHLTWNGKTKTITKWAHELKIPINTLWMRLFFYNWSVEKALTKPLREKLTTQNPT